MNKALLERMARREQLIAQAATQRASLSQQITQLRLPLAIANQGMNTFYVLRKHPVWIASSLLLLIVLKARLKPMHVIGRGRKWIRVAWFVYQTLNTMRIKHQPSEAQKLALLENQPTQPG